MMYNKLKDYTLDRAREMIHLDLENRTDDYLYNKGADGWLDFLSDPGLTFYLIGEGPAPIGLTRDEVLEEQFSMLRIDLALAYALVVKNKCDAPDYESFEIAGQFECFLRDFGVMELGPCSGMTASATKKQIFKYYQVRRRLRYAFRGLAADPDFAPTWYAHRFLETSLAKITAYLESNAPESDRPLTNSLSNAAVDALVGRLEEETGYGYLLRGILYRKGVLVSVPDDDPEDDEDCDY